VRSKNAFTLIELLVVIAIIAILMAILMPACKGPESRRARPFASRIWGNWPRPWNCTRSTMTTDGFEMRKDGAETDGYWWGKLGALLWR